VHVCRRGPSINSRLHPLLEIDTPTLAGASQASAHTPNSNMVEGEHNSPTWKFTQCFGDKGDVEDITEADIISTVEFDHTGNYLATGDKGGRVVLFERNETKKKPASTNSTQNSNHTSPNSTTSSL